MWFQIQPFIGSYGRFFPQHLDKSGYNHLFPNSYLLSIYNIPIPFYTSHSWNNIVK